MLLNIIIGTQVLLSTALLFVSVMKFPPIFQLKITKIHFNWNLPN